MNSSYFIIEDSSQNFMGGGQNITLKIINHLIKNKKKIVIFDTGNKSYFYNEIQKYKQEKLVFFCKIYNINIFKNKKNNLNFLNILLKLFLFLFFLFPNLILINYSIIKYSSNKNYFLSCTTTSLLFSNFIFYKKRSFKFIHYLHQYYEINSLMNNFVNFFLKNYDIIICVSKFIERSLKVDVKKYVINTPEKISNLKYKEIVSKTINILSISNLIEWKGINYLAESYKYLKKKSKFEYKIHIFGDGPLLKTYKQTYKNKNIKFYGYKSDKFLKYFIRKKAHISVVPSIKEEACPHLPILSFAYAMPCVSTNIGGQLDLIKKNYNGAVVPIKSSEKIADQIINITNNKNDYKRYSLNAKKTSKFYDLEKYLSRISKVLEV